MNQGQLALLHNAIKDYFAGLEEHEFKVIEMLDDKDKPRGWKRLETLRDTKDLLSREIYSLAFVPGKFEGKKSTVPMNNGHGHIVTLKTEIVNEPIFSSPEEFELDSLPKQIRVTCTGAENVYFDYVDKLGHLRHGFTKVG